MRVLLGKLKEVLYSVLPCVVIVLLLHFTVTSLPTMQLLRFLLGAVFIVLGLSIFLAGVDIGITPLGQHIGSALSKSNRIWIVVAGGLVVGFFISIAEPDLQILADQVSSVTGGDLPKLTMLVVVSLGIAAMLAMGLIRTVYNFSLRVMLLIAYAIILVLALFSPPEFLAIAFDASGATTGALTVPFILALAVGVSSLKKDSKASEEDSFGLVGITSTGAILGVLLLGVFSKISGLSGELARDAEASGSLLSPFLSSLPTITSESFFALLPLLVICIVCQARVFRFSKRTLRRTLKGLLYTFIGLVLFLVGVNAGFMQVGVTLGRSIAALDSKAFAVGVGFVLGLVTILAEPAVHVLTRQIQTVTSGYVKRKVVLAALSIGVGTAVGLSILRIVVPQIQLWHYLLPGFGISILLSFFAPKLFVGIGFDAGGVASGPMTATFILAFTQGVADSIAGADVLRDAFGMIAIVAMTPIITLQVLGLIYKLKSHKKGGVSIHESV